MLSSTNPSFLALAINACRSSPITSAMQVVETAIISGLYSALAFCRPRFMLLLPPNTAASSVIESETQATGSLKWRLK